MANVVYNRFKKNLADGGQSFSDFNSWRGLVLVTPTTGEADQDPTHQTVAACIGQTNYSEYDDGAAGLPGYPTPAQRPGVPSLTISDSGSPQNRAEVALTNAGDLMDFGSPAADVTGGSIRYVLIYEHNDDTDDALNYPIMAIDDGTVLGENGSGLPMTFSWGARVADILQG